MEDKNEQTKKQIEQRIKEITKKVAPSEHGHNVVFEGVFLHVKAGVFDPASGRSTKKMWDAIQIHPPKNGAKILEIGNKGTLHRSAFSCYYTLE